MPYDEADQDRYDDDETYRKKKGGRKEGRREERKGVFSNQQPNLSDCVGLLVQSNNFH